VFVPPKDAAKIRLAELTPRAEACAKK
jgi:hypothetical protein